MMEKTKDDSQVSGFPDDCDIYKDGDLGLEVHSGCFTF